MPLYMHFITVEGVDGPHPGGVLVSMADGSVRSTDTSAIDAYADVTPNVEASSRLFVGNLTLDSQASVDDGPDLLVGYSGSDWF